MSIQLLPDNFPELLADAVRVFWVSRSSGGAAQPGSRGSVIGGKNMDGFVDILKIVATYCGLPEASVFTNRGALALPGYYRPTKNWDVIVLHKQRLVAAFEFKSQVGSFGNNFNNRCEEVIGTATDLWAAHYHHAYEVTPPEQKLENGHNTANIDIYDHSTDPRPPFLGYLMLLQDCANSTTPVSIRSPHFSVFPEFEDASYAQRYALLCERLMEQNLYQSAALLLSPAELGAQNGLYRSISTATSARSLFLQFAAHAAVAAQS